MKITKGNVSYFLNGEKQQVEFQQGENFGDSVRVNMQIIQHHNEQKIAISLLAYSNIIIESFWLELEHEFNSNDKIFVNGYQSWTESREYDVTEIISKLAHNAETEKYYLANFGDSFFYHYSEKSGVLHSYTYTYIRDTDENCILLGSLNENTGYTIFQADYKNNKICVYKDCCGLHIKGEYFVFDLLIKHGMLADTLTKYFADIALSTPRVKQATGWTSWYNYYHNISEKIVLENLANFSNANIPLDYFQIDDGYQYAVGDWLIANNKFPRGMQAIAEDIHKAGYKAGLWIAPFICEENSVLRTEHPDWLIHLGDTPLVIGNNPTNWSGDFYVLDIYNKDVQRYLIRVFDTVLQKWGYDMVKLDFLYVLGLNPPPDKTRGELMCYAIDFLRKVCGDKIILACGVPLVAVFGKTDYCRIGSDVAPYWEDKAMKNINYRERVSTINSLTSTIGRSHLNNLPFINDPDVYILRDKNCSLSVEQKHTLFMLNLIFGGLLFTSDNIADYSTDTMQLYLSQFPLKQKSIAMTVQESGLVAVAFSIGDLEYRSYTNLSNKPTSLRLEKGVYFESLSGFIPGEIYNEPTILKLQAHQSKCYLIIDDEDFVIAGSTLNIFPGSEIADFGLNGDEIVLELDKQVLRSGEVYIKIPNDLDGFKVNNVYIKAKRIFGMNILVVKIERG